jgi:diguanylate cyclase (GGDEF)-like protein
MSGNKKSRIEEILEEQGVDRASLPPEMNAALMLITTEYEAEKHRAKIDEMTGLERKENLYPFLERNLSRAERHNEHLSVLMIDADNFKHYNDTQGHIQGDNALNTIGAIVRSHIRKEDLAVRYGGEEICVVLPETDEEGAEQVAEKIRGSIERTQIPKSKEHKTEDYKHITVSIGGFTYNPGLNAVLGFLDGNISDENKVKIVVDKADSGLYKAKNSGKNKYCVANVE